ncbi:MAG: S9 family peptidase [Nitriliruptorales bacterium]
MRTGDLARLRTLTEPQMHPDGAQVAFVVREVDLEEDRYVSRVWLWDGEDARPFTHGPSDGAPRWSPDGGRLVFVRKSEKEDSKPQVAVMPAAGGEARIVTDFPLGAGGAEWSPDGSRLVAVGNSWVEELADLEEDERKRRPRRITRLPYRGDNLGWIHERRKHLCLVDPSGQEEPDLLTPGDFDESEPVWRPDGLAIAFLSERHDEREVDGGNQVFLVTLDDREVTALTDVGIWGHVTFRPDGVAHVTGLTDRWGWPAPLSVRRIEEDGSLTDLTGHLDRDALPFDAAGPSGPQWRGDRFLTLLEDRGVNRVVAVDPDGKVEELAGGSRRTITGATVREDGSAFAFVATANDDPGELHWWEDGEERALTAVNATARDELAFVAGEHFTYESGGEEIDAWLYLPEGGDRVPLLFNIHGGPATQYGWGFFDEFQVYAGAGYAVLATNPRGSSGRGRDFARGAVKVWHEEDPPDLNDLRRAVDAALARSDRLDPERMGVMGGSYGGFATAHVIGREDRWRSAIVERGLLSWVSFSGTSDIGAFFDRMYLDAQLPEDFELLWAASPVSRAHRVTTPTLLLHSEHDWRCPIEQAEQFYMMLKRHGTEVELVRFPDEGHELSRSGAPKHRRDRFQIVLEWHGRHLDMPVPAEDEEAAEEGAATS